MAVVNTCAVTNDAVSVSRGKIRQIARAGVGEIVATMLGNAATQAGNLPNILRVVPNDRKDHLVPDILNLQPETFELEPTTPAIARLHRRTRHQGAGWL
jgi:tRNA A37 methylthiotransferase MiaB